MIMLIPCSSKLLFLLCWISLIPKVYSSIYFEQSIRLGLLVDFEDDISKGIRNESLINLLEEVKQGQLTNNITTQTDLITSYEEFESEVEDDPKTCDKYMGIISALSCTSTKSLYQLIRDHCSSTLLLSIHDRNCVRPTKDQGIGFPVLSSVNDVVPMLIDMRHDFLRKWDHISLIHDESIDVKSLHDLVDGLSKVHGPEITPSIVTTYHFGSSLGSRLLIERDNQNKTEPGVTPISRELVSKSEGLVNNRHREAIINQISENEDYKYFVVIARSEPIKELIDLAHNQSLLGNPRKWLLIFADNQLDGDYWSKVSPILAVTETAIVVREVDQYGECHELKEGCQMRLAMETLHEALRNVASQTDYDFTDTDMKPRSKNRLLAEMRSLLGSSGTASGQYCGNCDRYVLQTFQETSSGKGFNRKPYSSHNWAASSNSDDDQIEIQITQTGQWTPFKGLLQEADPIPVDMVNAGGREIKIGVVNQRPLVNAELVGGECIVNGTTIELLKLLSSRLNFTIKWVCWKDFDDVGTLRPDGSFDGLLGKLNGVGNEIDIAANGIWKTPSRIKSGKFEFFFPYDVDTVSVMVKKMPENERYLFVCPFARDTWICLIICIVSIGPIFWFIHKSAVYYDYYNCNDGKGFFKLGNCIWYCYGALVQQGGDILPQAISGRLLIGAWWLFVIVCVTTYSGNLVALLTFPKIVQPIENAQDLRNTWAMKWGVSSPSDLSEMVQVVQYSGLKTLRDGMKFMDFKQERSYIFDEVADGDMGFVMKEYEARHWVSTEYVRTEVCGMHVAKDALYRTPVHMVARKGAFPPNLVEAFNKQIFVIARAGIPVYWRLWFRTPANDCMYPLVVHAGDVKKVDLIHMTGSYVLLAWGIGIGAFVCAMEIVYRTYVKPDDRRGRRGAFQDMLQGVYARFNGNQAYSKWASNVDLISGDAGQKQTKLSFIHPQVKGESGKKPQERWNETNRPKASPNLYYDQAGPMYSNQIRGIYNDPENYNYYNYNPYNPLRAGYKPKP